MHPSLELAGFRGLVVGLAREGLALAQFLVRHGLIVTATDLRPARELAESVAALEAIGVQLTLGRHSVSLLDDTDVLFVSPGVPLDSPFIEAARQRGLPLTTESRLFCQLCPAPIVGLTGSSGKTTTTTLVGQILEAGGRSTRVGGNIGRPLIGEVEQVQPADAVVMELSSFQLEFFHPSLNRQATRPPALEPLLAGWSPSVAAVLNVTPNHLDRHPTMDDYIYAKRAIIQYQQPSDRAVFNLDDEVSRTMGQGHAGQVSWFSLERPVPRGAFLRGEQLILCREDGEHPLCLTGELRLRGRHNVANVLAACALAATVEASPAAMTEVITRFAGVEHRLEMVREVGGVRYFNDSIATSPERLVAALRSFEEPLILLAGGRDKHLPWDEAARLIRQRVRHLVLFGEAMELIARAVVEAGAGDPAEGPTLHRCVRLEDALHVAAQVARPGEAVLLSPGCTSFDAFPDFAARGARFRELVREL